MKREEIIKALRCCGSRPDRRDCEEKCPYFCGIDVSRCIPNMTSDASAMLESDTANIAALKAENERIRQNSVSQEAYQMMCEERDAAVAELKKSCNYQFGGCYLCLNQHTDLCKSCLRDDIWADIAKNPKDNWIWRGPQKGKE